MTGYTEFIFKTATVSMGWLFFQIAEYEGFINKAFDQLFSLGLLVIILIFVFKEYKSGVKYNVHRDVTYEELVKENIETRKDINTNIDKLTEAINRLSNNH